jgi:tetratricopeptide (TPR) repeat protein
MSHELHHAAEELRDRLSRATAVFIVLATLAAAVAGYLLALASRSGDNATVLAQRRAVEAAAEQQQARTWSQAQFDSFVLATEARQNQAEAARRGLGESGAADARFRFEEQRWGKVAGRLDQLTEVLGDQLTGLHIAGRLGPEGDPSFPARLNAETRRESLRREGLEDAANELASGWSGKSTTYTAILTLFAVSLYLLGFSQALRGRLRRLLAGFGVLLILAGAAWAGAESLDRPTLASDEAAARYADGKVALDVGWDAYDNSSYRQAQRAFSEAIRLRPSFAAAYASRATATFSAESPQQSGFISLTTRTALRRSIEDGRKALELGLRNVNVLASIGFDAFELGVLDFDADLLAESLRFNQEAASLAPRDPPIVFNMAVALLAAGEAERAEGLYRRAASLARGQGSVVAGALTDLAFLQRFRPLLKGDVTRMKEIVVAGAFPDTVNGGPEVTLSGGSVEIFAGKVEVQDLRLTNFDPDDAVVVEWYYDDPQHHGEFVLPEISGFTFLTDAGDGTFFAEEAYLADTVPARCLLPGTYRAELYVDGRLVGEVSVDAGQQPLRPEVLADFDVAMCIPPGWTRKAPLPGVVEGFESADGSEGLYVVREDLPAAATGLEPRKVAGIALSSVVDLTSANEIIPKDLTPEKGAAGGYFLGLDGGFSKYLDFESGNVLAGAGVNERQGLILVGMAFGPEEGFSEARRGLLSVFDSMIVYSEF